MKLIKKVVGHETSDGKVFDADKKQEAQEHQRDLNRIEKLGIILDEYWMLYDEKAERGKDPGGRMDIPKFINLKRDEIKRALR